MDRSDAEGGGAGHGLGGLWQIKVGDLRDWHVVEVSCAGCKHVAHLSQRQLLYWMRRRAARDAGAAFWARHAEGVFLVDLAKRLRCRRCGNRDQNTLRVMVIAR